MGAIGGLLGLGGGVNGTGQSGPVGTNILAPATTAQAGQQYNNAQNAFQAQQNFVNAVNAANGVGNQSNIFNQLQGVANGTGPNPAQAQLAQATGANTANQAALMAGQRGANANVGMLARQAAQQGAANQQNAAGQAATLQAQQSLGALNNMGNIANTQAAQQAQATQALNSAAQGEQGQILGAIQGQNQANVGMQSNVNNANAGLAQSTMQGQQNLLGSLTGGIGSALGMLGAAGGGNAALEAGTGVSGLANHTAILANGGPVHRYAEGTPPGGASNATDIGPKSFAGKFFAGQIPQTPDTQDTSHLDGYAKGGKVPALLSPGEKYLPPQEAKEVAQGKKDAMKTGKTVPGKPKVKGAVNSYANDTVKANLDEGGIVIPRSITEGPNSHWEAMKFVRACMAKNKGLSK